MEQNVIQINGEITISVSVSVKDIMWVKKIVFEVLLLIIIKMENI